MLDQIAQYNAAAASNFKAATSSAVQLMHHSFLSSCGANVSHIWCQTSCCTTGQLNLAGIMFWSWGAMHFMLQLWGTGQFAVTMVMVVVKATSLRIWKSDQGVPPASHWSILYHDAALCALHTTIWNSPSNTWHCVHTLISHPVNFSNWNVGGRVSISDLY